MRWLFYLVLFVFFIDFVSAYQLGVSPSEINIASGSCGEIYIFSNDYIGEILVRDRWSMEREENFRDYLLKSDELGIRVDYEDDFYLNGIVRKKFCFSGSGKYGGILVFEAVEGNVAVGVRINFNGKPNLRSFISGMSIGSEQSGNVSGFGVREMVLVSSLGVSLALVFLLFAVLRAKRSEKIEEWDT